jgi:hypothetical protein
MPFCRRRLLIGRHLPRHLIFPVVLIKSKCSVGPPTPFCSTLLHTTCVLVHRMPTHIDQFIQYITIRFPSRMAIAAITIVRCTISNLPVLLRWQISTYLATPSLLCQGPSRATTMFHTLVVPVMVTTSCAYTQAYTCALHVQPHKSTI